MVLEVQRHSRVVYDVEAGSDDSSEALPAIDVALLAEGLPPKHVWVPYGLDRTVQVGERLIALSFMRRWWTLPFSIRLGAFDIDTYPGTGRHAMYRSRVTLIDSSCGVRLDKSIQMNEPLVYRGYQISQSAYDGAVEPPASILGVSHDPGWPIVLTGYAMMLGGMLVTLTQRFRTLGIDPGGQGR